MPWEYSEVLPTGPGYYVYRLWTADGSCLYVGRIGDNGPRVPQNRLAQHRKSKKWWPEVAVIEIAELPDHPAIVAEEDEQIRKLRPLHNGRVGCGHDLSQPGATYISGACRECHLAGMRAYSASPTGRAKQRAYDTSPSGRARRRAYDRKRGPSNVRAEIAKRRPAAGQGGLW